MKNVIYYVIQTKAVQKYLIDDRRLKARSPLPA